MDMDGVLVHESEALPGADRFLARLRELDLPFLLLTNNSIFTRRDLAARLRASGLEVPEESIWTSASATARFLETQRPNGTAFVVGESGLSTQLYQAGYTLTDNEPDYVVLGETRTYSFERITQAIRLIAGGARFIATNPDPTGPSPSGLPPRHRLRRRPDHPRHRRRALLRRQAQPPDDAQRPQRHRRPLETTAMIGDRMDTDIDRRPRGRPRHHPRPHRRHHRRRGRALPLPPEAASSTRSRTWSTTSVPEAAAPHRRGGRLSPFLLLFRRRGFPDFFGLGFSCRKFGVMMPPTFQLTLPFPLAWRVLAIVAVVERVGLGPFDAQRCDFAFEGALPDFSRNQTTVRPVFSSDIWTVYVAFAFAEEGFQASLAKRSHCVAKSAFPARSDFSPGPRRPLRVRRHPIPCRGVRPVRGLSGLLPNLEFLVSVPRLPARVVLPAVVLLPPPPQPTTSRAATTARAMARRRLLIRVGLHGQGLLFEQLNTIH